MEVLDCLFFLETLLSQTFGKHMLSQFPLDPEFTNLNFGSFGSPPNYVLEKMRSYQVQMDFNPDFWFRVTIDEKLKELRALLSKFVNCPPEDLVFIQNASDGVNAILRSMITKQEKILMFDIAYPMVHGTLAYLKEVFQIEIEKITVNNEILNSDDLILETVEETIKKSKKPIKLAIIDHISSIPSVIFPVKRLTELLKKYNIMVLIDGAHAVGQIPIDLTEIAPDFYVSNFHKWFFAPKQSAFLYVSKEFQKLIHPNIITVKYDSGFVNEFDYTGTRDYASIFAVKDAFEFREKLNETEIMKYNHNLAVIAGDEVAKVWGTEVLILNKDRIGAMVNVRVPCESQIEIDEAVKKMLGEKRSFLAVKKFNDGKFYARLSAQIFNEIEDYLKVAKEFIHIIKEKKEKNIESSKI